MMRLLQGLLRAIRDLTWSLVDSRPLDRLTAAARRQKAGSDRGLATVEVAILAAVLLGLATALLVVITAVVNKHMSQIK